jgi:hypothetical protein
LSFFSFYLFIFFKLGLRYAHQSIEYSCDALPCLFCFFGGSCLLSDAKIDEKRECAGSLPIFSAGLRILCMGDVVILAPCRFRRPSTSLDKGEER